MPEESTAPELFERFIRIGSDFDALASVCTPDSVWDLNAWGIGTFEGLPAIRAFCEDWLSSYAESRSEADEILELDHGVVLVAYRERARPAGSEARLEWRRALVALIRDGQFERITWYNDLDEARAAAERLAEGQR
jgi:hypothetical protein